MSEAGRETDAERRLDAQAAALAARQHAVVALWQLMALGISERAVQRRAAAGRLHRVHRGVYALVPVALLGAEGRWMAAVLACGGRAALSHRSAADLHGLRRTERFAVDVVVPGRSTHRFAGVQVHRSTTLIAADLSIVDGIPCTTVARTLLDLAGVVNRRGLERALDQAEALRLFDLRALRDQAQRNGATRGGRALGAVLDTHTAGSTLTWSELEDRFLAACRAAGLPSPEVNAYVDPHDGEPGFRPDFVWRARRLALEVDGRRYHLTTTAFETDRRRDQRLIHAGWRVIRVTWRQLVDDAPRVTATVGAQRADAQA